MTQLAADGATATFACPATPLAVVLVAVQWRTRRLATWTHAAWRSATNPYDPPHRTLCGRWVSIDASQTAGEDVDGRAAVVAAVDCATCRRLLHADHPCDECGRQRRTYQVGSEDYPRWSCGTCEHRQMRRANTAEMYGRGRSGY